MVSPRILQGALILCCPWAVLPRPEASLVAWKRFSKTVNLVWSGFIMRRDLPLACSLVRLISQLCPVTFLVSLAVSPGQP